MRILSRICAVLSWVFLAITVFVHGLLILTLWMPPFLSEAVHKTPVENTVNARALPFVIVGLLAFLVGFFLFRFQKRGRWVWFAIMAAGALVLAGVGLYFKVSYPETIISEGVYAGYDSAFKVVWRHMLPLVITLLMLLVGVFRHVAEDRELRREAFDEILDKSRK